MRKFDICKSQQKHKTHEILYFFFKLFDLQLHKIYYSNITIDADSTVKQAIMLYTAYMHRVGLSLKKNVFYEEA